MKISVVTVTYNCASIITETLDSVIGQDYGELEYVVIDGGSNDGTLDAIRSRQDKIATVVSEPDKGIFDAMNKSLDYITGYYVLFMNAGDKFVNAHVVSDIFAQTDHDEDLIYGDTYVENALGFILRKADAIYQHHPTKRDLVFKSQGFSHQSLFTKTNILKEIGFNLQYPLGADYDTTAQVNAKGNHQLYYTGFPIAIFDDRDGGASHSHRFMPSIYEERVKMFGYTLTCKDKLSLFVRKISKNAKHWFMALCPTLTNIYRRKRRNYITILEK